MVAERSLVCRTCQREIECCYFCEAEDCPEACCYRCMVVELGEFLPQPHEHGG